MYFCILHIKLHQVSIFTQLHYMHFNLRINEVFWTLWLKFTSLNLRPVIYLPGKEFSVAVRFSPIKYALRPVKRINGTKEKSNTLSSSKQTNDNTAEENIKPWEKYQTTFCFPYRMVYAIATQNSIMLYDTQQTEPFARISRIHYIGLNDLSW